VEHYRSQCDLEDALIEQMDEKGALDATRFRPGVALQADGILGPKRAPEGVPPIAPSGQMAPFWGCVGRAHVRQTTSEKRLSRRAS
jgi:hypothetical protein